MAKRAMILCDTDVLVEYYKGNGDVIDQLQQIGQKNLCISVVSCGELFYGAQNNK